MFCHRTGSHKPDSELIGRFQKLCGKSFFNEGTTNNKLESGNPFTDADNNMTPSEGACKKAKGSLELPDPSFSFDGTAPEQCLAPESHSLDFYASQLDAPTTFNDLVEGCQPSKNISQENLKSILGSQTRDQFGDRANSSSLDVINPAVTWNSMDSFSTQGAYAPNQFPQPSSDFESMGLPAEPLNYNRISSDELSWNPTESNHSVSGSRVNSQNTMSFPEQNQFRYTTTLLASTAMVDDSREAAVSYLNKGQVYHLRVVDTMPSVVYNAESTQYRTFIRISFGEEQQRSDPAAYWQLWKSARGLNESKKRDFKLNAVEYVGDNNPSMHVEPVSHDGFSVTWTGKPADRIPQCSIPVRFNFLSTDFTLSKGVKGIQVRLCAKTKQLGEPGIQEPEICFCNVKLFRDHGAERKLSNDAASIRKRMEKLQLQMKDPAPPECLNKRKRGSVSAKSNPDFSHSMNNLQRQGDMSINLDNSPRQANFQQQLQKRLDALERCLYSSHPESFLNLRGGPQDDPELYPSPSLNADDDPLKRASIDCRGSSNDDASSVKSDLAGFNEMDTPSSRSSLRESATHEVSPVLLKPSHSSNMPAACFYIRVITNNQSPSEHYRALYLKSRTVQDLTMKISEKVPAKQSLKISSILHKNEAGLKIVVDDEFVQEMAEGQSMAVRIVETPENCLDASNTSNSIQREIWLEY
ncbi:hypothetical protein N7481_008500 [Penicillium waksmanii]|uniref:uncharacterized protein n=1 Tax=Penicillium waksmanii TaxID=69791 RepID=UPI0025466ED6|nr:uncharacterized protein N7481_008500 [Penicillium waksmanii]KAJ5974793.1 hypothetical protein N7481_008500 [Penicillium waksmanii]